jgi:cytochrome c peroxidase
MLQRQSLISLSCIVVFIALVSTSLNKKRPGRSKATDLIASLYKTDVRSFDSSLEQYAKYFYDSSYSTRVKKYGELVRQLKRTECLFTYFHPKIAYETFLITPQFQQRDFGPPFPDNWLFIGPFGIEPDSVLKKSTANDSLFTKKFIERAVTNFREVIRQSNYNEDVKSMTDADVLYSLRLQMVRISTIGLANGDFVIEEAGMPALEGAFEAWSQMVKILADELPSSKNALQKEINKKLDAGMNTLAQKPSFQSFNRMAFLTEYLIPLSGYLNKLQAALNIELKEKFAAFNAAAGNIYDENSLNPDFFAPGAEAYFSKAKAEVGKLLFFDPILSDNNERACASCHKPELAFTDGNIKSVKFDDRSELPRNAPTVINAAFQKAQFWDLRATSLEDQLDSVINNADELHSSFENVIARINSSKEYKELFHTAFPETRETGIQRKHVKIAIASFERTLTGFNSRFDAYVRGDAGKMNESEISGFNLFMGKAKCATCHYAPLFTGALPPYFEFTDHRSIGVPLKDTMEVYQVDPDTGASKVFKNPFVHFSFKVPTVRNAALTAPYMHNGVYKTLEQVVDFYNDAGGINLMNDMRPGMKGLPFFMILPIKLNLTEKEKKDLVAFMKTLTDTSSARHMPQRLPVLSGKYASLNKRTVGGDY